MAVAAGRESRPHAPVRVALDAMGGDHAPGAAVAGALQAHRERGVDVVLVGRAEPLTAQLAAAGARDALPVVAAADVVGMHEDPAVALRRRPAASIRVAANLVASGRAQALVSAGSTGATLAAALLALGRARGVRRPVVAAVLPLPSGRRVVLADAGGSADAQPEAVAAYAPMAAGYAHVLGTPSPRVGLLNVGAEPGKGSVLAKAAFALLQGTDGFVGNVEPAAVLAGAVDVVVTDGFTGNVFLKAVEAASGHRETGRDAAAVLLGVNGTVLIVHGDAGPAEIASALADACDAARARLPALVAARLAAVRG